FRGRPGRVQFRTSARNPQTCSTPVPLRCPMRPSRHLPRPRLRVEALEAREVPAVAVLPADVLGRPDQAPIEATEVDPVPPVEVTDGGGPITVPAADDPSLSDEGLI